MIPKVVVDAGGGGGRVGGTTSFRTSVKCACSRFFTCYRPNLPFIIPSKRPALAADVV